MRPATWTFITGAMTAACLTGCSLQATIVNHNQTEINATKVQIEEDKGLKIIYGEIVHIIPLKAIATMEIFPEFPKNFERELYYPAKIEYSNADIVRLNTKGKADAKYHTYVCVNYIIQGATTDGTLRLPLDEVAKITIKR
ncbi:MAG: hypothetical protein GF398_07515 [Chitinivibrionales bacterium]|nr:hypothetical protein [Chitinivibrionales bacterium]